MAKRPYLRRNSRLSFRSRSAAESRFGVRFSAILASSLIKCASKVVGSRGSIQRPKRCKLAALASGASGLTTARRHSTSTPPRTGTCPPPCPLFAREPREAFLCLTIKKASRPTETASSSEDVGLWSDEAPRHKMETRVRYDPRGNPASHRTDRWISGHS
jgi:hypothetical protein